MKPGVGAGPWRLITADSPPFVPRTDEERKLVAIGRYWRERSDAMILDALKRALAEDAP